MTVPYVKSPGDVIASAEYNDNFKYGTDMIDKTGNHIHIKSDTDTDVVVIDRMPRRNYNANTYIDSHIQSGWTYKQGTDTPILGAINVSFPIAFLNDNVRVVATSLGYGGAPSNEGDFVNGDPLQGPVFVYNITSSGFTLIVGHPGLENFPSASYYGFSWIAIGPVA